MLNLKSDFGAIGDGVANDTAAWVSAETSGQPYWVPSGIYNVTSIPLTSQADVYTAGHGVVIVRSITTDEPVFTTATSCRARRYGGMTIDRTVPATAGGNGIDAMAGTGDIWFENLLIQNQYNGVRLGPTGLSSFGDSTIAFCYADGILFTAEGFPAGPCALQWTLDNIQIGSNDGHDIHIKPVVGNCSLGEWTRIFTFASTGHAVFADGSPTAGIGNIRMSHSFLGENNTDAVFLDTYGTGHSFVDVQCESMGAHASGRLGTTPATRTGTDFNITSNNGVVRIANKFNAVDESIVSYFSAGASRPIWSVVETPTGKGKWGLDLNGNVYAGWADRGALLFGTLLAQPIRFYGFNKLAMQILASGELGLARSTPAGAPGAGMLNLAVVQGSQPGTAKIVAYAGTSTSPVTLLDNIGSGF